MIGAIDKMYHYPIKGLTPQPLDEVALQTAQGFPHDRMFGFARYDSGFDAEHPSVLPKDRFIVLVKEERLAGLKTFFDADTRKLTIDVQGTIVFQECLSEKVPIAAAVEFFKTMFDLDDATKPIFAHAAPHRFTDVSVVSEAMMNCVSLINMDSVREFEDRVGLEIDPLRFRANIYFSGWAPFSELEMVGREFSIGDVRMRFTRRTRRCAATEVNPMTAKRDIPVPRLIMQNYGHADMGIYAEVLSPGTIRPGALIKLQDHNHG